MFSNNLSFSSFSMSATKLRIIARAVCAVFFPSYLTTAFSSLGLVVYCFDRQSFTRCPTLWHPKHRFSVQCCSRSSVVSRSTSMVFGSRGVLVYRGTKVFFVRLVLLVLYD